MFIDSAMRPKRRLIFGSAIGSLMDMDENSQVQWFHSRWTDRLLTMMNWQTVDAVVHSVYYYAFHFVSDSALLIMIANPRNVWEGFLSQKKETVSFVLQVGALIQHTSVTAHVLLLHVNCFCCEVLRLAYACHCHLQAGTKLDLCICLLQNVEMFEYFLRYLNVFYALVCVYSAWLQYHEMVRAKRQKEKQDIAVASLHYRRSLLGAYLVQWKVCMGVVTTAKLRIRCDGGSVLRHRMSWVVAVQLHLNI